MKENVPPRRGLNAALWSAQLLVGAPFILFGTMKVVRPIAELAPMMPWTGEVPELFVRLLGAVDVLGGLGLLLPGLTGIKPSLVRLAAIGCLILQASAMIFHLSRGEGQMIWLNILFALLLGFILWGRSTHAPLVSRSARSPRSI